MFDLDNLKYVNDTYGHDFGDDYIRTAASVFRLFESERSIVARLSGDEFILFFYGYDNRKEIEKIKQRHAGKTAGKLLRSSGWSALQNAGERRRRMVSERCS